jgi:hypothetical protein
MKKKYAAAPAAAIKNQFGPEAGSCGAGLIAAARFSVTCPASPPVL